MRSFAAQPTSGSKLLHKCFGIAKEGTRYSLTTESLPVPVFLQPKQSGAGMLEKDSK